MALNHGGFTMKNGKTSIKHGGFWMDFENFG
jgi:hypothetical protein